MSERENGWYLRSDGYMTSECSYQRIEAMKGNRALDNHEKLVFIKYVGGRETDSRVYVPHPGTCKMHRYRNAIGVIDEWQCSECGADVNGIADDTPPNFCPRCGRRVKR